MTGLGFGGNQNNSKDSDTGINHQQGMDHIQMGIGSTDPTSGNGRRKSRSSSTGASGGSSNNASVSTSSIILGHIILGSNPPATTNAISHYTSMIHTMRKPISMWHPFLKKEEINTQYTTHHQYQLNHHRLSCPSVSNVNLNEIPPNTTDIPSSTSSQYASSVYPYPTTTSSLAFKVPLEQDEHQQESQYV